MHAANARNEDVRIAGVLYLGVAIAGAFALMYVPSQIMVRDDAATTAANMLENELLFRAGIVSHLVASAAFVVLVLVLYRLLHQVNAHQARLMVALVLAAVPVVFVLEAFSLASLMIVKGELLRNVEPTSGLDLAMLLLRLRGYGIVTLEVLWGLWLIPFGWLVYQSRFIPRALGILLIAGGIAYVVESIAFMLSPDFYSFVARYAFMVFGVAEISMIGWLLVMGVRRQDSIAGAS